MNARLAVRENVVVRPTHQIESRPVGQEIETGLGHVHPDFPFQTDKESGMEPVQQAEGDGGIIILCLGANQSVKNL